MGQTAPNTGPVTHVHNGVFQGYSHIIHQGNLGLYTQAPDAAWPEFRAVLVASRGGTDAALDAAATAAWGGWWASEVVARGLRSAARLALSHYLPPAVPIP
tara:strand:+ start:26 stop:328 length:303 start_codon:yes stop_codon:yes gene_type:complete